MSYLRLYTNIDQTLLWYAGSELIHGNPHQPNFYGQKYNTVFEAMPGALLHKMGLSFGLGIVLGTALLATAVWLILALTAYKKQHYLMALLALALPILIRVQYMALFASPRGILAGDLLAVLAVGYALWISKDTTHKLATLIAFGGLGVLWDYGAALIVIPVFVYVICTDWRSQLSNLRKSSLWLFGALLIPLAWISLQHVWYVSHTYDLTAPSVSVSPSWAILTDSIYHLSAYLSFFAPSLLPYDIVATIVFCATLVWLMAFGVKRRRIGLLMSTTSFILLFCLLLSIPRASNYLPSFYFSASRLVITLPIAMWVLAFLHCLDSSHTSKTLRKRPNNYVFLLSSVLVLATIVSFTVSQSGFKKDMQNTVRLDLSSLRNPIELQASCKVIMEKYEISQADVFASNDPNIVYSCAAENRTLNALYPAYDRRGWLIQKAHTQPTTKKLLVQGVSCPDKGPMAAACIDQGDGFILILSPPTTAASLLSDIGLPVKLATPAAN